MSDTVPQAVAALPVNFATKAEEVEPGLFLLGALDVPGAGLHNVGLLLDMKSGLLRLRAPCGCETQSNFSKLVVALLGMAADHGKPAVTH